VERAEGVMTWRKLITCIEQGVKGRARYSVRNNEIGTGMFKLSEDDRELIWVYPLPFED
jgi:hypothetical protein